MLLCKLLVYASPCVTRGLRASVSNYSDHMSVHELFAGFAALYFLNIFRVSFSMSSLAILTCSLKNFSGVCQTIDNFSETNYCTLFSSFNLQ